jgi:formylglycine-generating enzyme required for sulfatase activity
MKRTFALTIVLLIGAVAPGWAQGALVFSDGFGSGDTCAWGPGPCPDITVTLPGGVSLVMVRIPAGTFDMGSPVEERGRWITEDLHEVTLTHAYYIGKFEVTQAQWQAEMGTTPWTVCGSFGMGASYPAYCVPWTDITGAGGFIDQLNAYLGSTGQVTGFRLPTEAEWERAARAGNQDRFSHGDVLECGDLYEPCATHDLYMWWGGHNTGGAHPVGSKQTNGFGLYDMHGNVWEWVEDWWQEYLGTTPVTDPTGPASGSFPVIRGGGWMDAAKFCRSAYRIPGDPTNGYDDTGFRLARTAD